MIRSWVTRPFKQRLQSGPCTQAQLESPTFQKWVHLVHENPGHLHRKVWEYCYIAQALSERGMLRAGRTGLGFAVGQEPLPALFASFGCSIIATDLATEQAAQGGWVETNQHAASLQGLNQRGICLEAEFQRRVQFRFADMRTLPPDLGPVDFLWSNCAFEHLGSLSAGLDFVRESLQYLRPGGVAVHTTEYNTSLDASTLDTGGTVLYRRQDLEGLARQLKSDGFHIDIHFQEGNSPGDKMIDRPPYSHYVHLKLEFAGFITTSFGIIVEKPR